MSLESSTYERNGTFFELSYLTGALIGFLYGDTVNVAGRSVQKQLFGEAILEPSDFFSSTEFDVIVNNYYIIKIRLK